jgi:uncharacterized DUF497 family protein
MILSGMIEKPRSTCAAIGVAASLLITVVYTERGERIRIISARRANTNERRKYYQG